MVVAIDGPAGAGKSSVARAVAATLGFTYLDSGSMYRAVALAALRRRLPPAEVAGAVRIDVGDRVRLDGEDVTAEIRTAGGVRGRLAGRLAAGGPRGDGRPAAAPDERRRLGGRGP